MLFLFSFEGKCVYCSKIEVEVINRQPASKKQKQRKKPYLKSNRNLRHNVPSSLAVLTTSLFFATSLIQDNFSKYLDIFRNV